MIIYQKYNMPYFRQTHLFFLWHVKTLTSKNAAGGAAAGGAAIVYDAAAAKEGDILMPAVAGAAISALPIAKVVGVNDESVGPDDAQKGTRLLGNFAENCHIQYVSVGTL